MKQTIQWSPARRARLALPISISVTAEAYPDVSLVQPASASERCRDPGSRSPGLDTGSPRGSPGSTSDRESSTSGSGQSGLKQTIQWSPARRARLALPISISVTAEAYPDVSLVEPASASERCRDPESVTGSRHGLAQGLARLDQRSGKLDQRFRSVGLEADHPVVAGPARPLGLADLDLGHRRSLSRRFAGRARERQRAVSRPRESVTGSRHGLAQGLARLDQRSGKLDQRFRSVGLEADHPVVAGPARPLGLADLDLGHRRSLSRRFAGRARERQRAVSRPVSRSPGLDTGSPRGSPGSTSDRKSSTSGSGQSGLKQTIQWWEAGSGSQSCRRLCLCHRRGHPRTQDERDQQHQ